MSGAIPFFLPEINEEEIEAVSNVLRTGQLVGGVETPSFEREFADFLGMQPEQAVAVNSATAGLHLCLIALGIGPGDDVLVPTVTFTATAEVVERVGGNPIFVDIDEDTYCININDIERKMTANCKAIIPVHHSGRACDMRALIALAKRHNLFIIEDAAHAFPSRYEDKYVGALETDATVFSFYANKTMTTGGDGGMIISRHKHVADVCRKLRWHGIRRGTKKEVMTGTLYDVEESGYKYNMTEVDAAMGRVQLKKVVEFAARRRAHVEYYREKLEGTYLKFPFRPQDPLSHPWHVLTVCFEGDNAEDRRNDALGLLFDAGIAFSIHYRPLHQHSHWSKKIPTSHTFPVADRFYKGTLSLPLYPRMIKEDIDRVCEILKKV